MKHLGRLAFVYSLLALCALTASVDAKDLLESCVSLGQSVKVSSMCDFKAGLGLFRTPVKTNPIKGCPREIIVQYKNPQTSKIDDWVANRSGTSIQTCTAGVTAIRVKPGQGPEDEHSQSSKKEQRRSPSTVAYTIDATSSLVTNVSKSTVKEQFRLVIERDGFTVSGPAVVAPHKYPLNGKISESDKSVTANCNTASSRSQLGVDCIVKTHGEMCNSNRTYSFHIQFNAAGGCNGFVHNERSDRTCVLEDLTDKDFSEMKVISFSCKRDR
jgi:hypothetical protein